MDFELNEDQRAFAQTARDFAVAELAPHAAHVTAKAAVLEVFAPQPDQRLLLLRLAQLGALAGVFQFDNVVHVAILAERPAWLVQRMYRLRSSLWTRLASDLSTRSASIRYFSPDLSAA